MTSCPSPSGLAAGRYLLLVPSGPFLEHVYEWRKGAQADEVSGAGAIKREIDDTQQGLHRTSKAMVRER